jgi:hypothetical protein
MAKSSIPLTQERLNIIAKDFWAKVDIKNDNDCWNWKLSKTEFGYGRVRVNYSEYRAHRLALSINNKEDVPHEMCVCHRCDNPSCCNPTHLFIGSKLDNTHDMIGKGRNKNPPIHLGENHPRSKLTSLEVTEIRNSRESSIILSKKYMASYSTIRRIKKNLTRNYG